MRIPLPWILIGSILQWLYLLLIVSQPLWKELGVLPARLIYCPLMLLLIELIWIYDNRKYSGKNRILAVENVSLMFFLLPPPPPPPPPQKYQGEAKSAQLIGQAIANNPAFITLRKIEASREIAQTISNAANKVFLESGDLLLNLNEMNLESDGKKLG
jgi:hypothetical protein